jgi:hypothetical protein
MSTITFAYCWKPQPGQEWQAHEKTSGIVVFAATQAEAVAEFNKVWDFRAPVEWVYGPPPGPKREDAGGERALALGRCYERWTQRLEVSARDGMVELLSAAAALDELLELATK